MDDDSQEERARRIRKNQAQRKLEYDLAQDLKLENDRRENEQIENQHRNKYADMVILFISTLVLSYLALFILRYLFLYFFGPALGWFGISVAFINPLLHAAAWIMAVLSVYKGRSMLEDIFNWFV